MIVMLALLGAATPSTAAADDPPTEPAAAIPSTDKGVRYKAKTEIDFGERKVNGAISGPLGVYADSLADQRWSPLIRLRMSFDRELLASVESIR